MATIKSIEEKAKRYDEAIERSKKYYSTTDSAADIKLIGLIFPELKESEGKDKKIRKALIRAFKSLNTIKVWNGIERTDIIAFLEKQGEQKPAWSEEDESHIKRIIEHFEGRKKDLKTQWVAELHNKEINWLKSLRPQNRWKPSDEQMDALRYVTNFDYGGYKATLVSLYEQLKKLRGE